MALPTHPVSVAIFMLALCLLGSDAQYGALYRYHGPIIQGDGSPICPHGTFMTRPGAGDAKMTYSEAKATCQSSFLTFPNTSDVIQHCLYTHLHWSGQYSGRNCVFLTGANGQARVMQYGGHQKDITDMSKKCVASCVSPQFTTFQCNGKNYFILRDEMTFHAARKTCQGFTAQVTETNMDDLRANANGAREHFDCVKSVIKKPAPHHATWSTGFWTLIIDSWTGRTKADASGADQNVLTPTAIVNPQIASVKAGVVCESNVLPKFAISKCGGKTYFILTTKMAFHAARSSCKEFNADVVEINNDAVRANANGALARSDCLKRIVKKPAPLDAKWPKGFWTITIDSWIGLTKADASTMADKWVISPSWIANRWSVSHKTGVICESN